MKLTKKQAIILEIQKNGYKSKNKLIINIWTLAGGINNYWQAPLFITRKQAGEYIDCDSGERWAIKHYHLFSLFYPLLKTVKKYPKVFEIEEQQENTFVILLNQNKKIKKSKGNSYWLDKKNGV